MDTHGSTQKLETFRDNTAEFVAHVCATQQPMTLTVDGQPAVVVQDIETYRRLRHLAAQTTVEEGIRLGLEDIEAGRVTPVDEAFAMVRAEFGLPR